MAEARRPPQNNEESEEIAIKKAQIEKKLQQNGEKARLEQFLMQKLLESGWRDQMRQQCLEAIQAKGLDRVNLDDLVEEMLPKGRSLVPAQVKDDLMGKVKVIMESDQDYRRLAGSS